MQCPLKLFSILIGATLNRNTMHPMGSILFRLIVSPLSRRGFHNVKTYSTVQKLIYQYVLSTIVSMHCLL